MVLTPFQVGETPEPFDLLVVYEAHRLNQRANHAAGPLNKKFIEINKKLFGWDDPQNTELDWIKKQSRHSILMLDVGQTVRPADLPATKTRELASQARAAGRLYPLQTQMRISADFNTNASNFGHAAMVAANIPWDAPVEIWLSASSPGEGGAFVEVSSQPGFSRKIFIDAER